ncbi:hypothetical protein DSO57_1029135 [Entomophthora muscae]|uniref:Uncharacterized protein n=1 Tax=Entomophthora muscae TaxID=34485 RepID=A0ACC2SR41_9FUNG|nr:hypothetical protein DSO57_1029135 [Entomophthora muscae]
MTDTPIREVTPEQFLVLSPIEEYPAAYTEPEKFTPIPYYMLPELTEVTPKPTYTQEPKTNTKQLRKKTSKAEETEITIPMDVLDTKRYMNFFSPPNPDKVMVETVEETLKKAHTANAPLSPLICLVPVENLPMETE